MRPGRPFRRAAAAALAAFIVLAGDAAAATPRNLSSSFELEATNGYAFEFRGLDTARDDTARVTLTTGDVIETSAESSASYRVNPESIAPNRIRASFGAFGQVSVSFEPSGKTGGSRCRPFREGTFTGTIEFTGDNGFAQVAATSAEGEVARPTSRPCIPGLGPVREQPREEEPFPRLTLLETCMPDLGFGYLALDGFSETIHGAVLVERIGRIDVVRSATSLGPPSSFRFRRDLSAATLRPPRPFTGTGRYSDGRFSGDLAVPVPGREAPLSFAPARAKLTDEGASLPACEPIFLPDFARANSRP